MNEYRFPDFGRLVHIKAIVTWEASNPAFDELIVQMGVGREARSDYPHASGPSPLTLDWDTSNYNGSIGIGVFSERRVNAAGQGNLYADNLQSFHVEGEIEIETDIPVPFFAGENATRVTINGTTSGGYCSAYCVDTQPGENHITKLTVPNESAALRATFNWKEPAEGKRLRAYFCLVDENEKRCDRIPDTYHDATQAPPFQVEWNLRPYAGRNAELWIMSSRDIVPDSGMGLYAVTVYDALQFHVDVELLHAPPAEAVGS
jgi:hypothetical protein